MHPAMIAWWHARQRAASCGASACHDGGVGRGGGFRRRREEAWASPGDDFGGSFGVRRPLRFLSHRLDLDDKQVAELARILNDLKTERAQAAVDDRRVVSFFADALGGDEFDEGKTLGVASERVKSAERLRDALVKALGRIHALLDAEQRQKIAYLIRTGALTL
jgi:Spy/CpxP family protein refolding chaperone